MQNITIQSLQITNFKGIKNLQITFNAAGETNIYGANGTGKSSVFDAFTWLLFGKDSQDRKDFDIKNTVETDLNRQDHEVSAVLKVDGSTETIRRVFREKWVKRQGSEYPEMQGNETVYFWNEVPMQAGEFKARIESIISESIFKLLTHALYFNQMKWTDRRKILEDIAGPVTLEDLADPNGHFKALLGELQNRSLEDYKKVVAAKKKTIKDSLIEIAPRIEENLRTINTTVDFAAIEQTIAQVSESLAVIERNMLDQSKAHQGQMKEILEHQRKLHEAKTALNSREYAIAQELQVEYNKKQSALSALHGKVTLLEESLKSKRTLLAGKVEVNKMIGEQITELRQEWAREKARELVFDESQFTCPTCNREFETTNIEESKKIMQANFESELESKLVSINLRGKNFKKEIESNEDLIIHLQAELEGLTLELEETNKGLQAAGGPQQPIAEIEAFRLKNDEEFQATLQLIETLRGEATEPPMLDETGLNQKKVELVFELDGLKKELAVRDQINNARMRVAELKEQEKTMAQELAELEGKEFLIAEYNKARMDAIENRIDCKFQYVTFNMFNHLINGGTEDTCETLYKGVPFDSLNTAGKLVAGLDVINTLSDHYQFQAPIFADNRESVTHAIPVKSQLINLIVSPEDQVIRVL